jgi:DNA primase catalytic core
MSLHKLTAGDGYLYLIRQVAAADATQRGYTSLGDYYQERGESPGEWMGRGLSGLPDFSAGGEVTEVQMRALFGEGRHPDAERIEAEMRTAGHPPQEILAATRLGTPFRIYEAANAFRTRTAQDFAAWNAARGLPRDWPVPAPERARIRTEIAEALFTEQYGRAPRDARERAGFLARISRQPTTAVAGYDTTFSPVKSVSALWALAPRAVAEQVEQAHKAAVADVLAWLEDHAAYTRVGTDGVAQVEVRGLLAAAFVHRDSRAGDPDLHTHVAISNKVQAAHDGRWLALDGRPMHARTVAASERYNTRLEAELTDRLGVEFAQRPGTEPGKRPVRELVGMDDRLLAAWSARRQAIDARRAELAAAFQADHGRPPTVVEALHLAQQATLETRDRKHQPRSLGEQRDTWAGEARQVLGGAEAVDRMLGQVLPADGPRTAVRTDRQLRRWRRDRDRWMQTAAADVVAVVSSARATWQEHHVRAEAERAARGAGIPLQDLTAVVDGVVAQALSAQHSIPLDPPEPVAVPAPLRRSNGESVYTAAGTRSYTSAAIMAAERELLDLAARGGGYTATQAAVGVALAESAANGVTLNPGQEALVRQMACSGTLLQVGLAPAGTGKTTAMRALAQALTHTDLTGTGGHVVGLAPSAAAASVLGASLTGPDRARTVHTDTMAKLLHAVREHAATGRDLPDWVAAIGPGSVVIVDEAGMASTTDLADVARYVKSRRGRVCLIGDDQQLAAIGAGGVLRDIAHTHGALTLTQVVRFADSAEGAASLALRDGNPEAIAYLIDESRVHVGDLGVCVEQAYQAWNADLAAGRDAVMLAPTRDLVAELNARARLDRLAAAGSATGSGPDAGPQVDLIDGCRASAGDTIITRENDRRLRTSPTDWVKNGDRWLVDRISPDGGLHVHHLTTRRRVFLPADYVAANVGLGYATTVHGVQGVTAAVCHVIAAGSEARQLLYVALTRGQLANHLYLTVSGDGDLHSVITRAALLPPTAVDVLARILARDGSQISATSQARAAADPAVQLAHAAGAYQHGLAFAAEDLLGEQGVAGLDRLGEHAMPGLTAADAWPTLRADLALLVVAGADPGPALTAAIDERELATAADAAAVLSWRLDSPHLRAVDPGPLPWLPGIPAALAQHPRWGTYLARRSAQVADLADQVATSAGQWSPTTAPVWATALSDRDPRLAADLAVWRAALAVPETDPRPAGPDQPAAPRARHQKRLRARVTTLLGDPTAATKRWQSLAEAIDPRLTRDPAWPTVAARLTAAARGGVDIAALALTVGTGRPLPDELPAAALWWRLVRHLPAALNHSAAPAGAHATPALRPTWYPALEATLGERMAARVQADPAWPGLVAAVTIAVSRGWRPDQVLSAAHDLLQAGHDDDPDALHPDETTAALTWRVSLLTQPRPEPDPAWHTAPSDDHVPDDPDAPPPPEADPSLDPPGDQDRADLATPLDPAAAPATTGGGSRPDSDSLSQMTPQVAARTRAEVQAIAEQPLSCLTPAPDPAPAGPGVDPATDRATLLELNQAAADFYAARYPTSWARTYLTDRFGSDLTADTRFTPGYAPGGTALTQWLRLRGATDTQLLAAGLARRTLNGRLTDLFHDRLVLPIRASDGIVGFVARRNPAHDDPTHPGAARSGPKYLNTGETVLYRKGDHLYGMVEASDALAAGATPVLVEGPADAIAVTLAGDGHHVGVATLGTALTDAQADLLRPHLGPDGDGVIVATDPDTAGRKAATRAWWMLAARHGNPGRLQLRDGADPAATYTRDPNLLRAALAAPAALAATLVEEALTAWAPRLHTSEGRVGAMREALAIIGAMPPLATLKPAQRLIVDLDIPAGTVLGELGDIVHAWTLDPHGQARQHLNRPTSPAPAPPAPPPAGPDWRAIAALVEPRLLDDPAAWAHLAATLDRAHTTGADATRLLTELAVDLPADDPARHLRYRIIARVDQAAAPRPGNGAAPQSTTAAAPRPRPAPPRPAQPRPTGPRR